MVDNGDGVIIMSFEVAEDPVELTMILFDENNRFAKYLEGAKHVQQVH